MDSMRSLDKSLPSSNPPRPAAPEQLLQAFRTAALSVTNLYKTAVTDQLNNRQSGYQDALDDLLSFLDKENLGLKEGEGWRIRQWATERFERTSTGQHNLESDDEEGDLEKRPRSSSPVLDHKTNHDSPLTGESRSISPMRTESAPPQANSQAEPENIDRTHMFRFTATQTTAPVDSQMQSSDNAIPYQQQGIDIQSETSETAPIRVEVVNRGSRTPHRASGARHQNRTSNRDFTFTSGAKRKLQFPELFDISNIGNRRDRDGSGGGGKRGRFA